MTKVKTVTNTAVKETKLESVLHVTILYLAKLSTLANLWKKILTIAYITAQRHNVKNVKLELNYQMI